MKPVNLDGPHSRLVVERILAALTQYPLSRRSISSALDMHPEWIRVYLRAMIGRGDIHVGGWTRESNNYPVALYAPGPGKPVRKPRKVTPSVRAKRYRAKLQKDKPDEYMRRILLQRAKRLKPRRDIAASWITR
jgi:hypothetical protein